MHSLFHSENYLPQQMVIYILIFVVSSIATTFILENRFNSRKKTFILSIVIMYVGLFPKHFDNLPMWTNQLILTSFFFSNILLYKDRLRTKILASVITVTINMLSDYFTYFLAIVILGESNDTYLHKPYIYVIMASIFTTMFLINTLLWNRFYRNDKDSFFKNNIIIMIVAVVLNFNFMSILIPIIANIMKFLSPELKNSLNSFFMLYFIMMFISYGFSFYFIKSSHDYQKIKEENERLDYQNRLQSEYYRKIEDNTHKTAKLRHDINNIVQTINAQFAQSTPESYARARAMTQELNDLTANIQPLKYCHNKVVDVVLDDKIRTAEKHSIKVLCDVMLGEREDVSDLDLCRIFANLMDNAIHATKQLETEDDKTITVICREKTDGIYIKCENSFAVTSDKRTKKNDGIHGYGLKIIRELSKKYGGTLSVEKSANQFMVLVVLKTGVS